MTRNLVSAKHKLTQFMKFFLTRSARVKAVEEEAKLTNAVTTLSLCLTFCERLYSKASPGAIDSMFF
jgi:hypothetical protein